MKLARTLCIFLILAALGQQGLAQGQGWLGLSVTSGAGLNFNFETGKKTITPSEARVVTVLPDGPAAAAGIRVSDVVVAVDQEPISSGKELTDRVRVKEPGSTVDLRVKRRDEILDIKVVLGTRPTVRELSPGDRPIKKVVP